MKEITNGEGEVLGYVRAPCGAWHPSLRQPWGSAPACNRDAGHAGTHGAMHFADGHPCDVAWDESGG